MTQIKRVNQNTKAAKPIKWKPASRLGVVSRPNNMRLRWCEDTPENIAKKKQEGWEILDKTKFPNLDASEYDRRVTDSKGNTSTVVKRNELIAMVIPEETAKSRDEYFRQETRSLTERALSNQEAKSMMEKISPQNAKNIVSISPEEIFDN